MKLAIVFSFSALLLAAADQPAQKPLTPLQIPVGAVALKPGTYHFTDAQGKNWTYHASPFGVSREPEGAPASKPKTDGHEFDNVKATEDGDAVRFERPTPFGPFRWKTKKSDLNDMERAVWNRVQAAQPAVGGQD